MPLNPQHCSIHRSFPHPNQTDLRAEDLRFILTLRAVGKGHISSLEFRSGVIRRNHSIEMDETSRLVTAQDIDPDPVFPKNIFLHKLREKGLENNWSRSVMNKLGVTFTRTELDESMQRAAHQTQLHTDDVKRANACIGSSNRTATSASAAQFRSPNAIIFPLSLNESNGMEDARFVRFVDEDHGAPARITLLDGRAGRM